MGEFENLDLEDKVLVDKKGFDYLLGAFIILILGLIFGFLIYQKSNKNYEKWRNIEYQVLKIDEKLDEIQRQINILKEERKDALEKKGN